MRVMGPMQISTGDVMGDMHGAALVRELLEEAQRKEVEVAVYAVGGQRMKEAGANLIGGWCVIPPSPCTSLCSLSRLCSAYMQPDV